MSADSQASPPLALPNAFAISGLGQFTPARLTPADLAEMAAIEARSHAFPWRIENLRSSLESHVCIGLRHDSSWVAYAVLTLVAGEAELLLFVVEKTWQGRGLGRRFLLELLPFARRRAQTLFLEVRASNRRATELYETVGFNQVGVRPNYYPLAQNQREDALLFAFDLACLE